MATIFATLFLFFTSAGHFVIPGMIQFGADHLNPRLHQLSYHIRRLASGYDDDRIILYSCDWATSGNVITRFNQMNEGQSTDRVDQGMIVSQVDYQDESYLMPPSAGSISFKVSNGWAVFFRNGTYTIISTEPRVLDVHDITFEVLLVGLNDVTERVALSVDAFSVERTANKMSDYGNQTTGPNYVFDGLPAFETKMPFGAMVFGWEVNDILMGSGFDDTIFGWKDDDHLRGRGGNDALFGEHGSNTLHGGQGADYFGIYGDKAASLITDTILDFNPTDGDVLGLIAIAATHQHFSAIEHLRAEVSEAEMTILAASEQGQFIPIVVLRGHDQF
ncbi:MAG: calcium-binding protein [Pseudomonadota bacterium]